MRNQSTRKQKKVFVGCPDQVDRARIFTCMSKNMDEGSRTYGPSQTPNPSERYHPIVLHHSSDPCQHDSSGGCDMKVPFCMSLDVEAFASLQSAGPLPPVTTTTLSELDLNWITHNIHLRVDINYDHDLHFLPIKGHRGDQKRRDAQQYWLALAVEFRVYQHNAAPCPRCQLGQQPSARTFPQRLRAMFASLKDLLETLVPDRDHPAIAENLDLRLLMQQVEHGTLDSARLSHWLAELLKSHCAPMRDAWANEMAERIREGSEQADAARLVEGLEKVFTLLEAMKLDVANHQIRTFRYPLIEETISYQQGYFARKIQEGKFQPERSSCWYQRAREQHRHCESWKNQSAGMEPFSALLHGILDFCTSPAPERDIPDALSYDKGRIQLLREETQDLIYLRLCKMLFNNLITKLQGSKRRTQRTYDLLESRILALVESDRQTTRRQNWPDHVEEVAMEITRAAFIVAGRTEGAVSDKVYQLTIRTFKQNAFGDSCSTCMNKPCTHTLTSDAGQTYAPVAAELHAQLEQETLRSAIHFQKLSPLAISEEQKHWQQNYLMKNTSLLQRPSVTEDIGRRVAHIGVLHWKIWAGLVYLNEEAGDEKVVEKRDQPDRISLASSTHSQDGFRIVPDAEKVMEVDQRSE